MISLKIDVSKIDKSRLFQGTKGTYLDAVLIETPNNQYGDDYMIVESVSKEEREQGVKGAILGNAKTLGQQSQRTMKPSPPPENGNPDYKGDPTDLGF